MPGFNFCSFMSATECQYKSLMDTRLAFFDGGSGSATSRAGSTCPGTMSLLGGLMTCCAAAEVKRNDQTLTLGLEGVGL